MNAVQQLRSASHQAARERAHGELKLVEAASKPWPALNGVAFAAPLGVLLFQGRLVRLNAEQQAVMAALFEGAPVQPASPPERIKVDSQAGVTLEIDPAGGWVKLGEVAYRAATGALAALAALAEHKDCLVTSNQLTMRVAQRELRPGSRLIATYVCDARYLLQRMNAPFVINNRYGRGYVLSDRPEPLNWAGTDQPARNWVAV